mmetsp:Transcript_307/g.612  ORF Transcript_307/g.612 Transcript_307/m.612 type:complete len:197 (-) Transcript_307:373-963(-)
MNLFLLFTILSSLVSCASCFSPASGGRLIATSRAAHFARRPSSNDVARHAGAAAASTTRLHSTEEDKQAEIAALEERLRQLKDAEGGGSSFPSEDTIAAPVSMEQVELDDDGEFDGETDDSVMFSERWKEAKDDYVAKKNESNMGGIVKVGLGLAFVVLLGFFSQVPVGEESLQKYQDVKGSATRIDLGDLNPVQQ